MSKATTPGAQARETLDRIRDAMTHGVIGTGRFLTDLENLIALAEPRVAFLEQRDADRARSAAWEAKRAQEQARLCTVPGRSKRPARPDR